MDNGDRRPCAERIFAIASRDAGTDIRGDVALAMAGSGSVDVSMTMCGILGGAVIRPLFEF